MTRRSRDTAEVPLDRLVTPSRRPASTKKERELSWSPAKPQKPTQKLGFHSPCAPYAGPAERRLPDVEGVAPEFLVRYNPHRCAPFGAFEVYRYAATPQLLGAQLSWPDLGDCRRVQAESRTLVAATFLRIGHYAPRVRALAQEAA